MKVDGLVGWLSAAAGRGGALPGTSDQIGPATCSARSMRVDGAAVDWPLTLARTRWPTR